jgi:hypothetical protein
VPRREMMFQRFLRVAGRPSLARRPPRSPRPPFLRASSPSPGPLLAAPTFGWTGPREWFAAATVSMGRGDGRRESASIRRLPGRVAIPEVGRSVSSEAACRTRPPPPRPAPGCSTGRSGAGEAGVRGEQSRIDRHPAPGTPHRPCDILPIVAISHRTGRPSDRLPPANRAGGKSLDSSMSLDDAMW